MKCRSNKIGAWLDGHYPLTGSTPWAFYRGAVEALKVAGFEVEVVPCGHGAIHVINPPLKMVCSNGDELQLKLEV